MSARVVILRPQPGAEATVEAACALGLDALCYPLFSVEPMDWTPPDPAGFDALMLTSANAIRHAGEGLARYAALPLFVVGEATATVARRKGLNPVAVGSRGAEALIEAAHRSGHRPVLHLCGEDVVENIAEEPEVIRCAVYRAVKAGDAAGLAALLTPGGVVLVHSPRAGARLAALTTPEQRAALSLVAISDRALAATGGGWACAKAAPMPQDSAMLALAQELCDNTAI